MNKKSLHSKYSHTYCGKIFNLKTGRFLRQRKWHGYMIVSLYLDGKKCFCYVHRVLLALATDTGYKNKLVVNHINGIKTDNTISNLEWVTYSENSKHAYKLGLSQISNKCKIAVQKKHGRPVIDSSTNIIYPSFRNAALSNGIPEGTLRKKLLGHRPNNTTFLIC